MTALRTLQTGSDITHSQPPFGKEDGRSRRGKNKDKNKKTKKEIERRKKMHMSGKEISVYVSTFCNTYAVIYYDPFTQNKTYKSKREPWIILKSQVGSSKEN